MPYVKFDDPKSFADNKGSCSTFINYLSKEDFREGLSKEFFFNHIVARIPDFEITQTIDRNKQGLGANDAKFYTGSINFSQKELEFIGNDATKIRNYTIMVMERYASQFNRSVTIDDLNWYAKIEHTRTFKGDDEAVKLGLHSQGDSKEGLQTHVHFIIGRKSKDGKRKLSPKTNHRATTSGPIMGGFNRNEFKQESEEIFDRMFGYFRPIEESYQYYNTLKNGDPDSLVNKVNERATVNFKHQTYRSLRNVQKEEKIRKLANFICFGGKEKSVKKLDVDSLILVEQRNKYSSSVYRSLINLNEKMKSGQIPIEYDLTGMVLEYAKFLNQQNHKAESVEQAKVVVLESENSNQSSGMSWHQSLSVLHTSDSFDMENDPEEVRKRKKKRRDQEMGI